MEQKPLIISPSRQTPGIKFDPSSGVFQIFGQSYPEDANSVFSPIFDWLANFKPEPEKQYIVKIDLKYYNTATSKKLFEIIRMFNEYYRNHHLFTVQWFYSEDDEDILESGQYYRDLTQMPFEFIKK
ncbi:MAG TPA: DUF1987 domain-containing protein [Salinivirgaceae bacterium]|nr:DUF1987 domain-containing protein [Salinivirgaceae bacterium]